MQLQRSASAGKRRTAPCTCRIIQVMVAAVLMGAMPDGGRGRLGFFVCVKCERIKTAFTSFTAGSEFVSVEEVQTDKEEGPSGCHSVCLTLF